MSSVHHLREFVSQRLTAAAEEIFGAFEKTLIEYEEEIDRQRKLLHVVLKPEVKLLRIAVPQQDDGKISFGTEQQLRNQERNSSLKQEEPEAPQMKEEQEELCTSQKGEQLVLKQETDDVLLIPAHITMKEMGLNRKLFIPLSPELQQQHVCKEEEEVLTEQQLRNQERNSNLKQEEPEPPQMKEEQEELCTRQEGEQLVLKQETDDVLMIPAPEERDHREPEASRDQQLLSPSSSGTESPDQEPSKLVHLESTRDAEPQPKKRRRHNTIDGNSSDSSPVSGIQQGSSTHEEVSQCDFCENKFTSRFSLKEHLKIHTGEKPYVCDICGKGFSRTSTLNIHLRVHSGENLHSCNICGQSFNEWHQLKTHMVIHTDEKPYVCKSCGDCFFELSHLTNHLKIHTRENIYISKCMGEISDEVVD